jgi:hypothetical protein
VRELRAGHLAGDQRAVRQRQRARACARARGGERRGADGEVSALRGAAPATPRGEPRDLRRVPSGDWDARRAGTAAKPGYAPPAQSPQNNLPPIISCPACSLQLQPPPDAPLVACGGCRQVMQVPGVEAK